jgi:hypothetical protein
LIHKRYEKQGLLPSHFNIHKEKDIVKDESIPPPQLIVEREAPSAQIQGKVQLKSKFNQNKLSIEQYPVQLVEKTEEISLS